MKCADQDRLHSIVRTTGPADRRCPPRQAGDWMLVGPGGFWRVVDGLLRDPELRVCLVEPSWDRVDAARARAREAGIDDRLVVHHAGALELARAG